MRAPPLAAHCIAGLAMIAAACSPLPDATAPAEPPAANAAPALDALAERYVRLSLEIGEREPGYVDAYYGPPEWAEAAKSASRELPALREAADTLAAELDAVPGTTLAPLEQRRLAFLRAQVTAARTRLRMLAGEQLPFVEEAEGLFGVRPVPRPLAEFEPILATIEALAPGNGELAERVDALIAGTAIPADRLDTVMRAAIDECRRRTARHIPLPEAERFVLEFVTDKPWSGYNWYQGRAHSLIQINTDLPVLLGRAVDLGCHEGYPGHHVLNLLLEERLTLARGWIEFSIYPLYSPLSLIAEGSANYGIDLAFPDDERLAFERDVLYPLAGLDPALAARDLQLLQARARLAGARLTISQQYLDGDIDRAEAEALTRRYQLVSAERAAQSVRFTDTYRSYVINYGLGEDMVRAHIEAVGATPEARWAAMERLLSEPSLPSDLAVGSE